MQVMKNGQNINLSYCEQSGYTSKTSDVLSMNKTVFKKSKTGILYRYHLFNCRGTSKEINHRLKANTFKSIKQQEKNQTRTNKLIFENYKLIILPVTYKIFCAGS